MKKTDHRPSPHALKWLGRLFPGQDAATLEGDFTEVYREFFQEQGRLRAELWCWGQVLFSSMARVADSIKQEVCMWGSYIKTAFRNLSRQKVHTAINVLGLSMAVCAALFIFLFIDYELGFDRHIEGAGSVYRVVMQRETPTGTAYSATAYFPLAEALRLDFPDLESVTQTFHITDEKITVGAQQFKVSGAFCVEPGFYEMMPPAWVVEDDRHGAAPGTVVLTEELANVYFGGINCVGRRLKLGENVDLTVSGVVADPPANSSIPYKMLISWSAVKQMTNPELLQRWNYMNGNNQAFVKLPPALDAESLEAQLDAFKRKYLDVEDHETHSFHLQSLSDMHFDTRYGSYTYTTSRSTLQVFGGVALLILAMASINFINLSTARAMKRAKEMGMRKVMGAQRHNLISQVLGETALMIVTAIVLAVSVSLIIMPQVTAAMGITLEAARLGSVTALGFLAILLLALLFFNGLYPAVVLSRYEPAEAFRATRISRRQRSGRLRNLLVLLQFAMTQALIVVTLVMAGQMKYLGDKDLGFDKEGMLVVMCGDYDESHAEALRARWMSDPQVEEVSFAWRAPAAEHSATTVMHNPEDGEGVEYPISMKLIDSHYIDAYKLRLLAGENFTSNSGSMEHPDFIITRSAVAALGLGSPEEAVGRLVVINGSTGPVRAVLEDVHSQSLKETIMPLALMNVMPYALDRAHIRISGRQLPQTVTHIREQWNKAFPGEDFEYFFLDDELARQYESEARILRLIEAASLMTVAIGCLGLLGLVSFVLVQKTKEIGIRKVMGASSWGLFAAITGDFLKVIAAASVLSWPAAWWFSSRWLQGFAYRMTLKPDLFLLGTALAVAVALLVMTHQVQRAAGANPVKALKYE